MVVKKGTQIKQDINFLEYPLWFQDLKYDGTSFVWKDRDGYEYRSGYKYPDKVDIVILLYLLYKSQVNDYTAEISCSRYEILENCGLSINSQYYTRLKESLKRWSSVSIHFEGTFYDGGEYISKSFHIMKGSIDKETKQVKVLLDSDWIIKIKESQYFRYIVLERYVALKRPISRRLYELLCKNFVERDKWFIRLTKLGRNLPVHSRETKNGKVIYASDVLIAVKPAINEINKLTSDMEVANKAGISARDLFNITYEVTGQKQKRVICFHRHAMVEENGIQDEDLSQQEVLFELLKRRSSKSKKMISDYYGQKGFDYVKWNILYVNEKAKKNYSAYLQKALAENWAEEWAEEQRTQIEAELARQREEQKKQDEQKKEEELRKLAKEQVLEFRQAADALDGEIKQKLWNQAEDEIPENTCRPKMNIKIRYAELVLEHLNDQGGNFVRQVLNDFGMIFDIALKKERDQ